MNLGINHKTKQKKRKGRERGVTSPESKGRNPLIRLAVIAVWGRVNGESPPCLSAPLRLCLTSNFPLSLHPLCMYNLYIYYMFEYVCIIYEYIYSHSLSELKEEYEEEGVGGR